MRCCHCLKLVIVVTEWNYVFTVIRPPRPVAVRRRFRDHPQPTRIDLHYKTGKGDDWEREDFDYVKHSKIAFFSSVMGVAAIPAMFKYDNHSSICPDRALYI